jgi:hypothetical protein
MSHYVHILMYLLGQLEMKQKATVMYIVIIIYLPTPRTFFLYMTFS